MVIGADQSVELINRKGWEALGFKENEIIGRNWVDNFIPEWDRKRVRAGFVELLSGNIDPIDYFENTILTKSGEEKMVAWHNTVLKDEERNIISTLSSGEDITDRKRAGAGIETSERFAGFIKPFGKRYRSKLDEKSDEFIDNASDGVKRMQEMIKDLLEYSKIGCSKCRLNSSRILLCIYLKIF